MGNSSATLGQAVTDKRATENELRHRGFHLRYAGMAMQGWRRTMEDALAHHHPKFESNGLALFCVFDGHGGPRTAQYAATHFGEFLFKEIEDHGGVPTKAILTRAFLDFDWSLCTTPSERQQHMSCGTTVAAALLDARHGRLYICHCGDSRVLVFRHGKTSEEEALYVSRDHNPQDEAEAKRIASVFSANANIHTAITVRNNRVFVGGCSSLNVCRGFGDHDFKRVHGVHQRDQPVNAVPDVFEIILKPGDRVNVVLASDGVWNSTLTRDDAPFLSQCKTVNEQVMAWVTHHTVPSLQMTESIAACLDDMLASSATDLGKSTDNMAIYAVHINVD